MTVTKSYPPTLAQDVQFILRDAIVRLQASIFGVAAIVRDSALCATLPFGYRVSQYEYAQEADRCA